MIIIYKWENIHQYREKENDLAGNYGNSMKGQMTWDITSCLSTDWHNRNHSTMHAQLQLKEGYFVYKNIMLDTQYQ